MTDTPSRDRVLADITISTSADEVWSALRDPEKIVQWFGWNGPGAAEEMQAIFFDCGDANDEARTLAFKGVADRFEVTVHGDAATLRVVRSYAAGEDWDDVFEEMTEGWITFAKQLKLMLEAHAGQSRRVLYLSGNAVSAGKSPRIRA